MLRTHTGMRSFWQRPGVAAVLLPGPGARGAETAGLDPHAHLRAIGRAAAALTGPARVAADEAARAAETLLSTVNMPPL